MIPIWRSDFSIFVLFGYFKLPELLEQLISFNTLYRFLEQVTIVWSFQIEIKISFSSGFEVFSIKALLDCLSGYDKFSYLGSFVHLSWFISKQESALLIVFQTCLYVCVNLRVMLNPTLWDVRRFCILLYSLSILIYVLLIIL